MEYLYVTKKYELHHTDRGEQAFLFAVQSSKQATKLITPLN